MNNVLVCVTSQRTCDRLIEYGKELADGMDGDLIVANFIQSKFTELNLNGRAEVLEYLYQKCLEVGVNLIMIRSNNSLAAMISLTGRVFASHVVLGESHENQKNSVVEQFKDMMDGEIEVIEVPLDDSDNDEMPKEDGTEHFDGVDSVEL